jgi:hypothetical protein
MLLVDANNTVATLPRQLDHDYSFNVHLKGNIIHKSMYLQGCIKKATVKQSYSFDKDPIVQMLQH